MHNFDDLGKLNDEEARVVVSLSMKYYKRYTKNDEMTLLLKLFNTVLSKEWCEETQEEIGKLMERFSKLSTDPKDILLLFEIFDAALTGLEKAKKHFDEEKGYKLNTYASWWVRQSIVIVIKEHGLLDFDNEDRKQLKSFFENEDTEQLGSYFSKKFNK
jgi:hypothetical protein